MPVLYVPKQAAKANSAGKKLFYPRVQLTGNVNTDQVAREIAQLSSLTSGDVKNVIDNLVTVVARHLQSSEQVTVAPGTGGSGTDGSDPDSGDGNEGSFG